MADQEFPLPPEYEFVRPLGAGGFGEVVLARHRRIGRLVAVKRIHAQALADPDAVERFRREAKVLAATRCPSVVQVYDLRVDAVGAQLVMEYVPGQSLEEVVALGASTAHDALVLLRDVADALAAMAAQGIIHRDVKPGNVFVLPDGHAKLGDFGLARALVDPSAFRTAGGAAMGTPAYFPPEVSQGLSEPDARSDAYSFAVMAYEVLTGERPFVAPDALSLITAHWTGEPRPAATVLPGFPDAAWHVLSAGLARDPSRRLLPVPLVSRLAEVPITTWPPVHRTTPLPRRGDPTIRQLRPPVPGSVPGRSPAPPSPRFRLRSRTSRWVAAFVAATAVATSAVVWDRHSSGHPQPRELEVRTVGVEVDPTSGIGRCPRARFVFSGVLLTNGSPGVVRLQWMRPDGGTTAARSVRVSDGQTEVRAELTFSVRGSKPLAGEAELRVLSPEDVSAKAAVRYTCPGS